MKSSVIPLLALTVGEAAAQYFVLYGQNTMVSRIDPILDAGHIGTHVHEFVGAGNVNENSTFLTLREADCTSVGRADGASIVEDRSAYWHPSLYVKATNGSYVRVPMNGHQIYYENVGSGTMASPFEFPPGFRMVAGHMYIRKPMESTPTDYDNITQWMCHETNTTEGDYGGFPDGVTSCPDYPYFNGAIHFPHCWNGNGYAPEYPQAHMAYPVDDIQYGACPDSHPIRLPHILMENDYDLTSLVGDFQEDTFVLANGDPTGYSFHADFYNGWKKGVLHNLLNGTNACYTHDVGDCEGVTFDSSIDWATDCKATNPYPEDVDGPLSALPGCNPIQDTISPAPHCEACAAGVVGGACVVASSTTSTSTKTTSSSSSTSSSTSSSVTTAADAIKKTTTSTTTKKATTSSKTSSTTSKKPTTSSTTSRKTSSTSTSTKPTTTTSTTRKSSSTSTADKTTTVTVIETAFAVKTVTSTVTSEAEATALAAKAKAGKRHVEPERHRHIVNRGVEVDVMGRRA